MFSNLFPVTLFTDSLGVTRFDSERGRGTLLQKRFCEPA